MFGRGFEQAFSDWPKTTPINSGAGVHVTGGYVHPAWSQRAGYAFIAIWVVIGYFTWDSSEFGPWFWRMFFLLFIIPCGTLALFYFGLRSKLDIKIDRDSIQLKGSLGYKRYSRARPIEFRIDEHQKAAEEEAREISTGKQQRRVYRDAIEVVMQYGEKRVVIAEMRNKDIEKAKALLLRLGSLHEHFEEMMGELPDDEIEVRGTAKPAGDFGPPPDIR